MDDLPDRWRILIAFFACLFAIYVFPNYAKAPDNINTDDLMLVNGSTLHANHAVFSPRYASYAFLMGEVEIDTLILVDEIIDRESGGDPSVCNKEFGCGSGMGLTQLIPSTVKYCEEKLGHKIDPFNPKDNLECAVWLLENEGIKHWEPYSGPYLES